ncbi:MAG: ATP-binding protein [Acidobacteriota bacterium]|jgi:two-component system NtrC family sensor kinase
MRRRLKALFHSLSARLLIPLLLTVVAVLTIHAVVSFSTTRERFTQLIRDGAERSSSLILGATHDGMLSNRKDEVQRTIERLARGPGVTAIRIYDNDGYVARSAHAEELGQRVAITDQPCAICHLEEGRSLEAAIVRPGGVWSSTKDVPVLHRLAVIPNEPSCVAAGCHGPLSETPVLGVLDVEMSLARLEEMLQDSRRQVTWTALSLLLVTGAVVTAFVDRLIHRPVTRLQEVTERVARGDLDTRIDVSGGDELAHLAEAFNRMAADLKEARNEITEWSEKLEEKVVEKTGELRRAQRQVLQMEKMASLGKLSATVAHELNNPINGILTYARLVERELGRQETLDQATRDELCEYLRLMQHECSRCGDIVKNLLLFARRRGGAEMEPVDLEKLLDRSLMLVRHHLEMSNITLRREPIRLDGGEPVIEGDAGQLEQALVALFVNAVEAMSGPGYDEGELSVWVEGDDKTVRIHVADTGVGIHPDVLPQIFEPFFSTKHEESGVGLGLAVVYGIVRRHGGSIEVESQPGRGATFHLTLPRRQNGNNDPAHRRNGPESA